VLPWFEASGSVRVASHQECGSANPGLNAPALSMYYRAGLSKQTVALTQRTCRCRNIPFRLAANPPRIRRPVSLLAASFPPSGMCRWRRI